MLLDKKRGLLLLVGLALTGCDDDEPPTSAPVLTTTYDQGHDWICAQSESCQDVFNIEFSSGTTVTIEVTEVTGSSIAQLALYAPGVPLGDVNLLTGTANELRCNYVDGCDSLPEGQKVTNFPIATGGTYRLAVTRDWGESCGGTGSYRLLIEADQRFTHPVRTVNDRPSRAPGAECP